jgi:hypothetical protein
MSQRQIINYKINNLLVLVGCGRLSSKIILKFRACLDGKIFGRKILVALLLLFGKIYPTMD